MLQEKWLDLLAMIKDKFQVESDEKLAMDDGPGEVEVVIFSMPTGKFKLERTVRPRVLDKKTSFSHRPGADVQVDYVYSPDETVNKLAAFRWDETQQEWVEIQPEAFNNL